jgi:glycosyltransferase involved in cell wall biosynthesis
MRIVSTIHGLERVAASGTTVITCSPRTSPNRWLRNLRLLRCALRAECLIIDFALPEVIFFTALLFLIPFHKCRLYTLDFFIIRLKRWQLPVVKWSLRRIDKMLVHFRDSKHFENLYGVPHGSFEYVPFKINSWEIVKNAAVSDRGYIFVGGRSRRDFRTLFEAVKDLNYPVKILTAPGPELARHGSSLDALTPPSNVEIFYNDSDFRLFVELMANARLVVLPIVCDSAVQAGIGVYLLGMALRKCVIISEALGVSDVLLNGEACIVPPGNAAALRHAIDVLWRDDALRAKYAEAGYRHAWPLGGEDQLYASVLRAAGADRVVEKSTRLTAQTPAVSVIVPAYKITEYICDTLDSLRAQTFRDFETIVVNDGCPDSVNLERALDPYRNEIVYLRHENNMGVASARNTAIRAARAPVVALLDPDDIWEPDYLAVQMALLESHPGVDLVYSNATLFGETPSAGKTMMDVLPSRGEVSFRSLIARECYVFNGVTARREVLMRAGLFDPDFKVAEDFDLWLRLARSGARFFYHDRPLVRYRCRGSGLSRDEVLMRSSVVKVYTKLLLAVDLSCEDRIALEAGIEREEAQQDLYLGKEALYAGNRDEAFERFGRANRILNSAKLRLALLALRVAPKLLRAFAYRRTG